MVRDAAGGRRFLNLFGYTGSFTVYAAAVRVSDEYLLTLQKELADALVEGVILVERQDVTIL